MKFTSPVISFVSHYACNRNNGEVNPYWFFTVFSFFLFLMFGSNIVMNYIEPDVFFSILVVFVFSFLAFIGYFANLDADKDDFSILNESEMQIVNDRLDQGVSIRKVTLSCIRREVKKNQKIQAKPDKEQLLVEKQKQWIQKS